MCKYILIIKWKYYLFIYIMNNIGILDPDGKNMNPLNKKEYWEKYRELAKIWSKFPAYEDVKKHIEDIKNNEVILIISGTGWGKTVLFPKYALHVLNYEKKVVVTLPKQIITKVAAEFSAKTLDVELGKEVGFSHKNEKNKSSENKLLYVTDGTLVAMLLNNIEIPEIDIVVIDEAHERKVQVDLLLYLMKQS